MRQTEESPEDTKLRTALTNMRYGACTREDIEYLQSRTVSRHSGHPTFEDPHFRHVSMITTLNAQKDKINEMGTDGHHQVVKPKHTISAARQQQLWDAYPCSTREHVPGRLSLCIGRPIMIRHNEATELCMTKGQEGKVVGWQEAVGSCGQTVLDTLFLELNNPPRPIKIDGLPVNVVAISKMAKKVWCQLPDDMVVHIIREQESPEFSMWWTSITGKHTI
ncbi:hypothetical protein B0H10DRAFT_2167015 [Mycena sp. CBHHK59/15]|nr:hypothetical protein B0H10DRAFT_2167015 [Mycena sp. CBHHK59/15]